MSKEILMLVDVLSKEKNIDKEIVFESLEKALALSTRKSFGEETPDIDVRIDRHTGKYSTIRKWVVTSDIDFYDDDKELSLSDAQEKYGNEVEIGDVFEEELDGIDLGRVSAQTTRNLIAQNIKDAERDSVINDFLSRNDGLVIGKVRKFERGNVIVECGKIEAIIMRNEQINKELFKIGDLVRGFFDKEKHQVKNGRISLSRTAPQFLSKLIEHNVPEVVNGKVVIKGIARECGIRAKVALLSIDHKIDAKGACIGFRNQRVESILRDLAGEKIDFVEYDDDIAKYVINALAPAEISSVVVDKERRVIDITVDDDKLGSAIGLEGVNVRLASQLLDYTINVYGETESINKNKASSRNLIELFNENLDVDDDISSLLVANGFTSLEEVAYVDISELLSIEDFDQDIAIELQSRAKDKLLSKFIIHKEAIDKLSVELTSLVKFSNEILLSLVEHQILTLADLADLAVDELVEIVEVDATTANKLILKARELSGYFD